MNREYINTLLNGYFHQDWMEDANEPSEVVDNFIRTSGLTSPELQSLAIELQELAQRYEGKDESWLYQDFQCDFAPSGSGMTASEWFRDLAQQLMDKKELAPD